MDGWRRSAEAVFNTSPALERGMVLFRLGVGPVLVVLAVISRGQLPYWEAVIAAAGVLVLANLALLPLLRRKQYLAVAVAGTVVDTTLLAVVSNLAIRASADEVSTSEMWLIFPLLLVSGAYRFRPAFSFVYIALLSGWYAAHITCLFPSGARALRELPIRIAFFVLMGVLATIMSHALRRERTAQQERGDRP